MTTVNNSKGAQKNAVAPQSAMSAKWARRREIAREVFRNPLTVVGFSIIGFFLLMALFAPLITEPNTPDAYQSTIYGVVRKFYRSDHFLKFQLR
jgi:peptide/nickel transport system permease protein